MTQSTVLDRMISSTAGAGVAVRRVAHNVRQDGKAEDARRRIALLTREIGHLTVTGMDQCTDLGEPIAERYAQIVAARKEIQACEERKHGILTTCPHCGSRVIAGMSYCGTCGKELAREPEPNR